MTCAMGWGSAIAVVGDDLNDLAVRRQVGVLVATADGAPPLRRQTDFVLDRPGGHGAGRELAERLLQPTPFCRDRND